LIALVVVESGESFYDCCRSSSLLQGLLVIVVAGLTSLPGGIVDGNHSLLLGDFTRSRAAMK
jgi:hypothetical protein